MSAERTMHGLHVDPLFRFLYPPNWKVEEFGDDEARAVEVESPDRMAYLLVSLHPDRDHREVLTEALGVMVTEYEGLHSTALEASIDGQPAQGYDIEFVSLDFPIGCILRSIETPEGSLLIQGQWSEVDDDTTTVTYGDVVAAMVTSIELSFTYDDE